MTKGNLLLQWLEKDGRAEAVPEPNDFRSVYGIMEELGCGRKSFDSSVKVFIYNE